MMIGYARVSTQDQNLDLQTEALIKAGCKKVFDDNRPLSPRRITRRAFPIASVFIRTRSRKFAFTSGANPMTEEILFKDWSKR